MIGFFMPDFQYDCVLKFGTVVAWYLGQVNSRPGWKALSMSALLRSCARKEQFSHNDCNGVLLERKDHYS